MAKKKLNYFNHPRVTASIAGLAVVVAAVYLSSLSLTSNTVSENTSAKRIFKEGATALESQNFKKAFNQLEAIKDETATKNDFNYYLALARAAYMSGERGKAKEYAKIGAAVFYAQPMAARNIRVSNIFDSIIAGEYSEVDKNQAPYVVPKTEYEKQGFQG